MLKQKKLPPNTFLMARFKRCFSMSIINVIQFVLKVLLSFSLSTVGTDHLTTYGGWGGEVRKYLCYGLKKRTRNLITKKYSCGSKIPPPPQQLSNGPSLS